MPKKSDPVRLRLNLLKPQGTPEKVAVKLIRWLLSVGRFIIVLVEALVLIAFLSRFKFDADLEDLKEKVDNQIPFIQSLKNDENLIRQTQLKLSIIKEKRLKYPDYEQILSKISSQTPTNIKITSISIDKKEHTDIKIVGTSITNIDISEFAKNLKKDNFFSEVELVNVGLQDDAITFSLNLITPSLIIKEKNI